MVDVRSFLIDLVVIDHIIRVGGVRTPGGT
jgi:hypothetical protein